MASERNIQRENLITNNWKWKTYLKTQQLHWFWFFWGGRCLFLDICIVFLLLLWCGWHGHSRKVAVARKRGLQFCRLCFQNLFCYLWEYSSQMIRVFSKNKKQIKYLCSKISPWVESGNTDLISSDYHFSWSTLHARVTFINSRLRKRNLITKTLFPPRFQFYPTLVGGK